MDIKFANMYQQYKERGAGSVIKCETNVITMTLQWHSSQIFNLGNYVDDTPTETGLSKFLNPYFIILTISLH